MSASREDTGTATDDVLKELQRAVQEHERILHRQEELIRKLRDELKGVQR